MFFYIKISILTIMLLFIANCGTMNENFKNINKISGVENVVVTVHGKGAPPRKKDLSDVQKYLFAERAAVLDGYRLLEERLQGILLTSSSYSNGYEIKSDSVDAISEGLLRGVKIINIKHNDNGVCEAILKINLPKSVLKKLSK